MSTGWLFGYGDGVRVTEEEVRLRQTELVPFIVGYGGGVNSTAMVIQLFRRGLVPDAVLFADPMGEKPETYEFLWHFARWCFERGIPLVRVRRFSPETGDRSLEEGCLRLRTLPSRAFGQSSCAFKWKIEAQAQWLAKWPPAVNCWEANGRIIKALGYDAGEQDRATVHEDSRYRYWYPLMEWAWDREDCKATILSEGLPLPPKSACFFCPSSKPEEVVWLWENHPDLYERAVAMERRAIATGDLGTVKGLGRHWTWESVIGMAAEERAKLPKPAPGCVICSEGACDMEAA